MGLTDAIPENFRKNIEGGGDSPLAPASSPAPAERSAGSCAPPLGELPAGWKKILLGSLYDTASGLSKSAEFFGRGNPFLSFKDVFVNFFLPDTLSQMVQSAPLEIERCSVQRGDVFLTRTSETQHELGMSSVALKDYPLATFNGFTKRLRIKPSVNEDVDPVFIGYYLRGSHVRKQISSFSSLTTRASLNNSAINQIEVLLPPIEQQFKIGKILKYLDDKIALNRATNQTLEHIAQVLFKSWFIDFDPVHAKARREKPFGMDDATAALFPDSFEESELGLIPKGWEVGSLADIAVFQNGYAFKSKDWSDSGCIVIKIGDVKPGVIDATGSSFVSEVTVLGLDRFKLNRGDLIVGMTGYVGESGIVPKTDIGMYLNQRVGRFATKDGLTATPYIYCIVHNPNYKSFAEGKAKGSAQANISGTELLSYPLALPSAQLIYKFNQTMSVTIESILTNYEESKSLELIRDSLLPKLLSGEITLSSEYSKWNT